MLISDALILLLFFTIALCIAEHILAKKQHKAALILPCIVACFFFAIWLLCTLQFCYTICDLWFS